MTNRERADYYYKASQLYNALSHQEKLAQICVDAIRDAEKSNTTANYAHDQLKVYRAEMERLKTEISELKQPTPDILGQGITEPEDIEQHEFILFKNLAVGDSFYNEDLTRKWVKISSLTENHYPNAKNVTDGTIIHIPPHALTYQRIKIDTDSRFMDELRGDFTNEELKNYQPK